MREINKSELKKIYAGEIDPTSTEAILSMSLGSLIIIAIICSKYLPK